MDKAIFFLHTTVTTPMITNKAFAQQYPGVRKINIVDDSILPEMRNNGGQQTPQVAARMEQYVNFAAEQGAVAGVCTCTTAGTVMHQIAPRLSIPVFSVNMPMLKNAMEMGKRVAALVTTPTAAAAVDLLASSLAAEIGASATVDAIMVPDALAAINSNGDKPMHDRLIAQHADQIAPDYDVLIMAQLSMLDAAALITTTKPVLTGIEPCLAYLKRYL